MERRVLQSTLSLATLLAGGAGLSCGSGIHDADEEQSVTKPILAAEGGTISFMGAQLDINAGDLAFDAPIRLTWRRTIAHAGALSSVFGIEVDDPSTFQKDPTITIPATEQVASDDHNVIGFMVPANGQWIPETYSPKPSCPDPTTLCGPVQSQTFQQADLGNGVVGTTNVLRLAIVTRCWKEYSTPCPQGQSCAQANACQQCPEGSPCP